MKRVLYLLFIFVNVVISQTTPNVDQNYILTTGYFEPFVIGQEHNATDDQKIESIDYFDGLGRQKQNVGIRGGGDREDLVTPVYYDALGRQPKNYLPYPELNNHGTYSEDILTPLLGYYYNGYPNARHPYDINPYTENRFEASPLNRILETGAPGKDWEIDPISDTDHTIKFDYQTNTTSEVKLYRVTFSGGITGDPQLSENGFYIENTLFKSITKDENWTSGDNRTTQEFKNKQGQVVLKRSFNAGVEHDTYYVYDDFGNLSYVLPPLVDTSVAITTAILDDLCYQYKYDYRNRLMEKKIPGKDWEYILYDNLDRPVLTQDANLRADNNKWLFTKYDALGRVAYTGIVTNPPAKTVIEQNLRIPTVVSEERVSTGVIIGDVTLNYTNWAFPTQDIEVLTINYYDDYADLDYTGVTKPQVVLGVSTTEDPAVETTTKGLPTVSKVRVLGTTDWTTILTAYDEKGRVIYLDSNNEYLDTRDIVKSRLDFTGKVLESETTHSKTGNTAITTMDYFTYDHVGRLVTHLQEIDAEPLQLIAHNVYDELGQLLQKKVGGELWKTGYSNVVNVSVSPVGVITKNAGLDAYDAGLATIGVLEGDGGLSFTNVVGSKRHMVGFNNESNAGQNQFEIDYRFEFPWENQNYEIKVKENGVFINLLASPHSLSYTEGDTFAIEKEDDTLYFIHNGSIVADYVLQQNHPALIGKMSFATMGASIEDLNFYATNINKYLQKIDYKYNIRGWLTHVNKVGSIQEPGQDSDLFQFRINYNNSVAGTAGNSGLAEPLYNGNISQTIWKSMNLDNEKRTYGYKYDDLNRITAAFSRKGNVLNVNDNFEIPEVTYDKNGNILSLKRDGDNGSGGIIRWDKLTYNYGTSGNKLIGVQDISNSTQKEKGFNDTNNSNVDYLYDDNGNMTADANKDITISYNHLNLPTTITRLDPISQNTSQLEYVYDATGIKQAKVFTEVVGGISPGVVTKYAGNYLYSDDVLQFFNHPEGYIIPVGGTANSVTGSSGGITTNSLYSYVFQFKDHLGNVRLSYSDSDLNGAIDAGSEIIEESNYYPFGLKQKGYNNVVSSNGNSLAQAFKYNEKELNSELSLEWYDFGARNYDPALGRWMNPDPLADLRYELTPYNYVQNSPMFKIDPDGLTDYTLNKKTGAVTQVGKANDEPDRILKTYTRKSKRGEVKYKKNGEAKVAIGGIEQGILSDGQNFKTDDTLIEAGGEGQASVDGVKSFTLQLSEYVGKEIKGFSYSSNGSGDVTDMVLGKYINNLSDKSYGTTRELQYKYRDKFSFNNVLQQFHTHPDGKLGATQSAPGQSQDVTNLQNDKPKIFNATFIILYRINGQKKPAEYDFTHEYRPKRK